MKNKSILIVESENTKAELEQVQELLEKERETFFPILHKAPYGIALIDNDGKFIYTNPAFTNITGYTLEDIFAGRDWFHRASPFPEYRQQIINSLKRDVIQKSVEKVFSLVCKNGEIKEIEFKPTLLDDGRIVVIFSDITEHKRAEESLRESEENYRSLIESARDAIFTLSPTGMITSLNTAFEKITGWSCAEWIGKPFVSILHPDDLRTATDLFGRLLQGEMLPIFELRVLFKSGGYGLGEFTVTPQIQKGIVKGFLGIARDITERKRAEEALRESESRFHLLVEHSTDTLLLHDFDGKIMDVNRHACESLGYTREELLGLSIQDIDQDFIFGEHTEKWKQMVPGIPITLEGVHKRKDGMNFPVEVRLGVFELGGRKLMLGLVRDITERKRMEEEREKLIHELQDALVNVKTLRGLLPICSHCKKIRDDKGYWNQIESYIRDHSGAEFTHGMCPECMKKLYPDLVD